MSAQAEKSDTKLRLMVLRQLIQEGMATTQEELCDALAKRKFEVNQSTVSRDLRRIGAIKATNPEGEVFYRLPDENSALPPQISHSLDGLLHSIEANEFMIVLHSTPGSASLVARHIDSMRIPMGIIGTIAGDDTVFVVPGSIKKISTVVKKIREVFH